MSTPEGKVKTAIKQWLDEHGYWRAGGERPADGLAGWYYMPQNIGMGVNGIPDFLGSGIRGYVPFPFAIEAKAPGKKPTAIQLERHTEMRAAGWLVLVVDDVSQLSPLEIYSRG